MCNRLVFRINQSGAVLVVAAPSRRHAAILLGISSHLLKKHGSEVCYGAEYDQAMSEPGAVFMRPEEGEWMRKLSSKKSMTLPTRGGYRQAAGGRQLLGESVAQQMTIRLSDQHHEDYCALGGTKWLRGLLASPEQEGPHPTTQERPNQPMRARSIRLSDEDRERYKARGGAVWLRKQIDQAVAERNKLKSGTTPDHKDSGKPFTSARGSQEKNFREDEPGENAKRLGVAA
ncbi:hypothetical protein L4Z64_001228 [Pseudomonas aeruginosa]|nr:hypothetical protein [Pseudomonas aeruginosa]HCH7782591.1 hypothetical protein [Pseudomonas aeruginosa]